MSFLSHYLFDIPNKDTYPPFKNGLYLEEYFYKRFYEEKPLLKKTYIPCKWTNFQIHNDFHRNKLDMQKELDDYINANLNPNGYFTIIQYDDGPLLKLPDNTTIYSACYKGDVCIPLIYEDINNTLETIPNKTFNEKNILCSFVGSFTHNVRHIIANKFENNPNFQIVSSGAWTPDINQQKQHSFIDITVNSKFAFGSRGYGLSSFRLYEIFLLGTIPIYVYDDICWLPYQEIIDYHKFMIVIHINEIDKLENILLSIDENKYNEMIQEYHKIKQYFTLDGMYQYIINREKE